jgi:hypothetical protein
MKLATALIAAIACLFLVFAALAHEPHLTQPIGDRPVLSGHLSHDDIVAGRLTFAQIFAAGKRLFDAPFNKLDGQGRPEATGNGTPTSRAPVTDPELAMLRTSAPDANACAGCHIQPRSGGAGDFVANVFVLAQGLDPVTLSVARDFSNERNTLGMMGAGPIELLGREMTRDLLAIAAAAKLRAAATHHNETLPLTTKGVSFGAITARPDGTLDTSAVEGVDTDLIVKPFHQKGAVRSIREFTVNAMNHHHGMQAVERFGLAETGTRDFDRDGVEDELSIGDITAATIFQAALNTPGRVFPADPDVRRAIARGEQRFAGIGCAGCHVPALPLDSPDFCEPYGLNTKGTFSDTSRSFCFNLTKTGEKPRLDKLSDGRAVVRAFTDLKRHRICDADLPHYCNEKVVQAGIPLDQFITRKLWDVGNSAPYGHRGDLSTITEAILAHGAEGRASRDQFAALSPEEQAEIVEFLKTLQIVPDGSPIQQIRP